MPSKVGERCATCRHAKRTFVESGYQPKLNDVGLICRLNDGTARRRFVNPWNDCDKWEPKEAEQ